MERDKPVQHPEGLSLSLQKQEEIATYVRAKILQIVSRANSGHLGGPLSSTELLVALYFGGHLKFSPTSPHWENRDRVLVRGFLGPLRYTIFSLLGWIDEEELTTYRQLGSRLQGHEAMEIVPGVDITPSGSLGMLLSYGVGAALVSNIEERGFRVFVFLGDGEEQEGNVSEAARHAAALNLSNLIAIIDKNQKQLSRPTNEVDVGNLTQIWKGYGWEVFEIQDGHNLEEINYVYRQAINSPTTKPRLIVAHTIKGHTLPLAEQNVCGYHTVSSFGRERLRRLVSTLEISDVSSVIPSSLRPSNISLEGQSTRKSTLSTMTLESLPQSGYGEEPSLVDSLLNLFKLVSKLSQQGLPFYVLTADLIRKDIAEITGLETNPRFFDVGIREQHMFATAHGISVTESDARVIINSNDAFLYRAADQIHAIAQGRSRVIIYADDGGLSGAYNGETHQSVGQTGALLFMSNATVFEPADSKDFWKVTNWALRKNPGLVYIRLFSGLAPRVPKLDSTPWMYRSFEPPRKPELILISAGLTSHDAYLAAQELTKQGIPTRAVNVVCLNSILSSEFIDLLYTDTNPMDTQVLTIYNGHPLVLQSLVSSAILQLSSRFAKQVVGHGFIRGTSGHLEELKKFFKLDKEGIIEKAKSIRSGSQVA